MNPIAHTSNFQLLQSHEYLITVVQHTGAETIAPGATSRTSNLRLNFNHPVKTLVWGIKGDLHGEFTTGPRGTDIDRYAPLQSAKLQLNGHDRMDERTGAYFNQVQPWEHIKTKPASGVYLYSFSLKPDEQIQPSGSVNLSRIDNATLVLTTKAGTAANVDVALDENTTLVDAANLTSALVYAESYNVLRILSGMGGLAYSSVRVIRSLVIRSLVIRCRTRSRSRSRYRSRYRCRTHARTHIPSLCSNSIMDDDGTFTHWTHA
jgi:hypothetical protein